MKSVTNPDYFDYVIKVVVIGDSGVGKTNMILKYTQDTFKENYMATLGVDFKFKTVHCEDKFIKLQIWDTAGQERFNTITQSFYQGACAIIMCYSIDNLKTFKHINKWA